MTDPRSRVMRAVKLADETGDAAWLRFAVVGGGQARAVMWAIDPSPSD